MASVLFLGLLIGMQHALEADHVAAVASIATAQKSRGRIVAHGAVWGIGHTVTLMAVAGGAVLLGGTIEADVAGWLETGVGIMLVGLGAHVLYRMWRDRVHYHLHRHGGATVHVHAHSHADREIHDARAHDHAHPEGLPWRTLLVGMMHGMAGSAALLVLTASSVAEPGTAFLYIAVFGIGSVAGMALLSAVIAVPLTFAARTLTWSHRVLQGGIGVGTIALGVIVIAGT